MNCEQQTFILNNYNIMDSKDICKELNIKPYQLNYFLRKNNLTHNTKRASSTWAKFSEEDIKYMKENYLNMTYSEIAKVLGFTERQIRGKINNMHLPKNRKINDDYFDNIDSPLKAYFLGFIFADGWICANEKVRNYEFGMELQSGDKYVLEVLNNELGGQNIIYHSEPKEVKIIDSIAHKNHTDILRIYSKPLVMGLMKNGIETNKSKKDVYPVVSEEFFFDFLRGYIDGDGCYYVNKKVNTYMHITCASISPLIYIQNILSKFNIKTTLYTENENKHRLMCTDYNSMKILVSHLYYEDGLFCLKRKYEKIKHLLGFAA